MKIVIGSLRQPKIDAVKSAFANIQKVSSQNEPVEFLARESDSNIPAMPLSIKELMTGAYNRVQNLKEEYRDSPDKPDFYVGLEGGFFGEVSPEQKRWYFLQSWVYVSDGERGYFGASGATPVPERIVDDVIEGKNELGEVIDNYGTESDIRDKYGAFGVFTQGLITRQASFEFALLSAFAPFFNQTLYVS